MALDPVQRALVHGFRGQQSPDFDFARMRRRLLVVETVVAASLLVAAIVAFYASETASPPDPRPLYEPSVDPRYVYRFLGEIALGAAAFFGALVLLTRRMRRWFWLPQLVAILITLVTLVIVFCFPLFLAGI